jgi:polysaccharide biosynthesis/export protein
LIKRLLLYLLFIVAITGCSSKGVMFKPANENKSLSFPKAHSYFTIKPDDKLTVEVNSNGGEKIIDPLSAAPVKSDEAKVEKPTFEVDTAGFVRLPLVGRIEVAGKTLSEAEQQLQQAYEKFYKDPFVRIAFANKRVVVLGAYGNLVVPLENENIRLTEVLALTKTPDASGKVNRIRVLRENGYLIADLSNLSDVLQNNVVIEPNDIIYVEEEAKPFREIVGQYAPIASLVTALATLFILIQNN